MAELSLDELVQRKLARQVIGDGSMRVRGIRHDSRAVEPGDLFAAIDGRKHGTTNDGADFAPDALARGAHAVLSERPLAIAAPQLVADDALVALAAIARVLYDDPTASLDTFGVTGTNGKTTITYLIEAILHAHAQKPAVVGTVNVRGPGGERPTLHTTPMADDMMRHARWAVDTGATHLVLEVSSHGLAMHRADGVRFKVAAFTNLTQDHLDYHGDFARYGAAKKRLFTDLTPELAVINIDDAFGAQLAREVECAVLLCSAKGNEEADIFVREYKSSAQGIRARVHTPQGEAWLRSPLVGDHNLENILIAIGSGLGLGVPLTQVLIGLGRSAGAPGRLERVTRGEATEDVAVFVDYAHTPDALERVLRALRPIAEQKLWAVFGCGGDRDRGKRPLMGRAAAELADVAIATSDNPRSEPPAQILEDIEVGLRASGRDRLEEHAIGNARGYHVCEDRRVAIRRALLAAAPGDVVLIAGKGHEKYQIIGSRKEPFDDCEEARVALGLRGGGRA
jgi:UDP-N-acetylmuramoyl-L-alanyl-D-glutamate--2,6-diaminopimelate ligase